MVIIRRTKIRKLFTSVNCVHFNRGCKQRVQMYIGCTITNGVLALFLKFFCFFNVTVDRYFREDFDEKSVLRRTAYKYALGIILQQA